MSTTITRTSDTAETHPDLVLGYATSVESRNVIHDLIDGSIAVTLVAARPRAGTLELFYVDEAEAWAALSMHRSADSFTIVDSDRPDIGMTYVVDGRIGLALDDSTRDHWQVSVGYQEVVL